MLLYEFFEMTQPSDIELFEKTQPFLHLLEKTQPFNISGIHNLWN